MRWIHNYQLFLFDFDGLLVNTEEAHFRAYKKMCEDRGYYLDWDFDRYIQTAHYTSAGLEEQIYSQFPKLKAEEPNWSVLYNEKKQALISLFKTGQISLMPGVESLLKALADADIKRVVVTHSDEDLVKIIREQNASLHSIPHWITRRDYSHPKPHPECYQKAVELFAAPDDKVIGFEDTPRGLRALMQTRAVPVLVSAIPYPEINEFVDKGVSFFRSLEDIPRHGPSAT